METKSWGLYLPEQGQDIASAHNMTKEEATEYFQEEYPRTFKHCEVQER